MGVLYPIVSEAVRGVAVTVGAPYYNFFGIVFGLPLILLMGVGPLVAWRKASLRSVGSEPRRPGDSRPRGGRPCCCWAPDRARSASSGTRSPRSSAAAIVLEFVRGTRARRALGDGSWPVAFGNLVSRNRRRYGGYVVHAAIVLLLVGAIGVGAFGTTHIAKLAPG